MQKDAIQNSSLSLGHLFYDWIKKKKKKNLAGHFISIIGY